MSMEPIVDKFEAFGWNVHDIDGHDFAALAKTFETATSESGPTAIILRTIKAKGIKGIEGLVSSHYWKPSAEEITAASGPLHERLRELDGQLRLMEVKA